MLFLCSERDVFANFGKHLRGDAEERFIDALDDFMGRSPLTYIGKLLMGMWIYGHRHRPQCEAHLRPQHALKDQRAREVKIPL